MHFPLASYKVSIEYVSYTYIFEYVVLEKEKFTLKFTHICAYRSLARKLKP